MKRRLDSSEEGHGEAIVQLSILFWNRHRSGGSASGLVDSVGWNLSAAGRDGKPP
jgi:hypothetical protein